MYVHVCTCMYASIFTQSKSRQKNFQFALLLKKYTVTYYNNSTSYNVYTVYTLQMLEGTHNKCKNEIAHVLEVCALKLLILAQHTNRANVLFITN